MTHWNAALYESKHAFVWNAAGEVLRLLDARPGERILDLGCGTGQLTAALAAAGAMVVGIDNDPAMIEAARRNAPEVRFEISDARTFALDGAWDAVFSNAALHWIPATDAGVVLRRVRDALTPGGRFVAEFGGAGNVARIVDALLDARRRLGHSADASRNPWHFPTADAYRDRCEDAGLNVALCVLVPRPTRLEDGERGLAHWIEMFAGAFVADLDGEERASLVADAARGLRPHLFHDGAWHADYVRLRVSARRPAS